MMTKYRIDQDVEGVMYKGGKLYDDRQIAVREAKLQKQADRDTGEYRTSYIVVKIEEGLTIWP